MKVTRASPKGISVGQFRAWDKFQKQDAFATLNRQTQVGRYLKKGFTSERNYL